MILVSAWKKYKEFLRKEAEINKAKHRLAQMPFDYQAIQTICDTVSCGYDVKITVKTKLGDEFTFEKTKSQMENSYPTFAERYTMYHNGEENK